MTRPYSRLPFHFDTFRLQQDLARVRPDEWITHFRVEHFRGEWGVVPLRSVAGHPAVIYSVPHDGTGDHYLDTPILERMEYVPEILSQIECPVNSVRLMKLGPHSEILEHRDDMGDEQVCEVRLHLPVQTNPEVQFYLDGDLVSMTTGELWFADFSLPHRVVNSGTSDRIHLVIDCVKNQWLSQLVSNSCATPIGE